MRIKINPLSVNAAWKGRRFKTQEYKRYEKETLLLLPDLAIPTGEICLNIVFGFSSKLKDIDNPLKPFIDILQKKYKFNDRDIYRLSVEKEIVPKGCEYIEFQIHGIN